MLKLSVGLFGLFVVPSVFAGPCPSSVRLSDFTVYSVGNMEVQQSDYQGLAGAGGYVLATDFQFNSSTPGCLALSAGGDLGIEAAAINGNTEARGAAGLNSTSVRGDVVAMGAYINHASVRGNLVTQVAPTVLSAGIDGKRLRNKSFALPFQVNHSAIAGELVSESARLAALPATNSAKFDQDELILNLRTGMNVFNLATAQEFSGSKRVVMTGSADSQIVVNIPGDDIVLKSQNFILNGGLRLNDITWNFYQTSFLHISHTADGKVGMPGRVMAPKALVEFNEALITGALYAGEIVTSMTSSNLNAGQVNRPGEKTPVPVPAPKPE